MGENGVTLARDDKAAGEQLAALPLVISSDSPVIRDSFTWTLPETTLASAGIWLPAERMTKSSCTKWLVGMVPSIPSRTTWDRGAERRERESNFFLGMELLDDADGSVGGHHQEENQLSERAHRNQKTGDDIEDDVKEGEEVLQDNPLHRFGGRFWRGVDLASLDPFSNLGGGEARRSLSGRGRRVGSVQA